MVKKKTRNLNDNDQLSTNKAEHHEHREDSLKFLKQNYSAKITSVKLIRFVNIMTTIYVFGLLPASVKIICPYVLFAMNNFEQSIKPSKMKRHLITFHSEYPYKSINFFTDKKK